MAFRNQVSSLVQSIPNDLWQIPPMNQLAWLKYFKDLKPDHSFLSWLVTYFKPDTMVFRFEDSEVTHTYEEMCAVMGHHPEQDETPALPPGPRYDLAEIGALCPIVAAALAQDRAQNQATPASSSQPAVEERQIPEPVSDNWASMGNTVPVENDVIKQLAELKDKIEKMSMVKEKDPVTNFHITEVPARIQSVDMINVLQRRIGEVTRTSHQKEETISRGKTYPSLEIFITDYEEKLIKSPEPSLDQLVDGTEFMVGMTEASIEFEWSKKISEFEDFWGLGMNLPSWCKSRRPRHVLAAEDAEEAERKILKMKLVEEKVEATPEEEEGADADEVIQAIKNTCNECIE
ncbi:hypothetical protein JCGZ_03008 [Jatropha curcas]|uniref:Uncharacterized protein n=1 Tax=Jatropha curcas TaxID=180498 RepID=A0A067L0Z7_JATCU|nr:hypothetical protein JCGZ_03008 [Jatropha curcas]